MNLYFKWAYSESNTHHFCSYPIGSRPEPKCKTIWEMSENTRESWIIFPAAVANLKKKIELNFSIWLEIQLAMRHFHDEIIAFSCAIF